RRPPPRAPARRAARLLGGHARPRPRRDPPRSQTGERDGGPLRGGAGARLGGGEGAAGAPCRALTPPAPFSQPSARPSGERGETERQGRRKSEGDARAWTSRGVAPSSR